MTASDPASETYFTERPRSASARRELRFLYRGELLSFLVDSGVFSSTGLDPGTSLLIEQIDPALTDRVLDVGCGWGALGVAAAKAAASGHVVMTEVNRRAAHLAAINLSRNRLTNAEVRVGPLFEPVAGESFDLIVTNPPYRAGRPLVLRLLETAPAHLHPGGRLLLVGKGSQGILFYQHWLEERWPGGVRVLGRRSGYRVLEGRPSVTGAPAPEAAELLAEAVKNRPSPARLPRGGRTARRGSKAVVPVRTRGSGTGE